jgi:hypothetical protein
LGVGAFGGDHGERLLPAGQGDGIVERVVFHRAVG